MYLKQMPNHHKYICISYFNFLAGLTRVPAKFANQTLNYNLCPLDLCEMEFPEKLNITLTFILSTFYVHFFNDFFKTSI